MGGGGSRHYDWETKVAYLKAKVAYLENSGPAGVQVTRRERSAVVRLLAGRGHRLGHLLRIAGLPKSTYYHHLSRPAHVSRPDVEPMVREIWDGSTSTNGGGTSSNASASASP